MAFPALSFSASSESLPDDSESLREESEPVFFGWSLWKKSPMFDAVVMVFAVIAEEEEGLGISVDLNGLRETEDIEMNSAKSRRAAVSTATPKTSVSKNSSEILNPPEE